MSTDRFDAELAAALRALPPQKPAESAWSAIAQALPQAKRERRLPVLAMAATVCGVTLIGAFMAGRQARLPSAEVAQAQSWLEVSQVLEQQVRHESEQATTLSGTQWMAEQDLTARLQSIDSDLQTARGVEADRLWQRRAETLDVLRNVYRGDIQPVRLSIN
jgi:hypothetical protein